VVASGISLAAPPVADGALADVPFTHRPGLSPPRAKIVCTLGPATATEGLIGELIGLGMNVARINFSHGTQAEHAATVAMVRAAAQTLGAPVAILGDLQGPRIRIGDLSKAITLDPGTDVVLVPERLAHGREIPITYDALASDVHPGDCILVNDGLIELIVMEVAPPRVSARVVHGGELLGHKGMNLPGVQVSAPSITDKDRADVEFAIAHDLDYVALSFVRRAEDIAELRALIPRRLLIIAKIEKDAALRNIEAIVRAADGVMVARGDLGVELPFEEVPVVQKRIIRLANQLGRPVITATQMLESMVEKPRPTRAEASDVANAILDGTDAVMLSAETATGAYPRLAVGAMHRIICGVEGHWRPTARDESRTRRAEPGRVVPTEEAIAAATVAAARMLATPLVIVITKSGFSARVVASHRPNVPILALTDEPRTYRQLALVWGVVPHLIEHVGSYEAVLPLARAAALARDLSRPGDRVLVTAGVPFDVPGSTNLLKVEIV
jgi:pyruvate kinase